MGRRRIDSEYRLRYKDSRLNLNLPYSGYKYDFVINSGQGDVKIYPATKRISFYGSVLDLPLHS